MIGTGEIHHIYGGLAVLVGAVVFMKLFDFLAAQSIRRLLEAARRTRLDESHHHLG